MSVCYHFRFVTGLQKTQEKLLALRFRKTHASFYFNFNQIVTEVSIQLFINLISIIYFCIVFYSKLNYKLNLPPCGYHYFKIKVLTVYV